MAATGRDPEPEFDGNFLIPPHRDAILLAALDVVQDLPAPAQRIYTTVIAATVGRGYLTAPGSLGVVCVHSRHPDRKNFNRYRSLLVDRGLIQYVAGDTKPTRKSDGSVKAERAYTYWTLIPPAGWSQHVDHKWFSTRSTTVPPRGYGPPRGTSDPGVRGTSTPGVPDTSTPGVPDTSTPGVRETPQKQFEEETVAGRGSGRRSSSPRAGPPSHIPAQTDASAAASASPPALAAMSALDLASGDTCQAAMVVARFAEAVESGGGSIPPSDMERLQGEVLTVLRTDQHTAGLALAALAYWWVDTEQCGGKFLGSISKTIPGRIWSAYQALGPSPTAEACLSVGAARGEDSLLQRGQRDGSISRRRARAFRTAKNLAHWADDDDQGDRRAHA